MNYFKVIGLVLCIVLPLLLVSQNQDIDYILTKKYAENSFRDGDFNFAIENYLKLYQDDKQNMEFNYRLGICYTEANVNKATAIPYLEFVVGHNNYPVRSYYYLGRAYMYNYRFTEAVEAFYEFKMGGVNEELLQQSDRLIQKCYGALELILVPRNVSFHRLDTTINTIYDDYNPFVNADNTELFYTSKKTYVKEYEDYIANIFYSSFKKGMWSSSLELPVNTYDNEESVGLTPNADRLLIYADGDYFTNDIKLVNRKGSKFIDSPSSDLPSGINTEGMEMGASLSSDGNTLIFASDIRGGRGGLDLYRSTKDASGIWSAPENMGALINTEFDDNFPFVTQNGKKLYFSSKGHSGIGGYDFFETSYSDEFETWTPPKNLGFPINTPLDNTTISFTADGKHAYVAANRKEGVGNMDIYRLDIGADSIPAKFYIGTVMVNTNMGEVPYSEDFLMAYATFYDKYDNIYAQYEVQSDGGQFFASIFPGEYTLEVVFSGVKSGFSKKFNITQDSDDFISEIIVLQNVN